MRRAIAEERRAFGFERLQVEYTHLADYGGDVLVEHDVTFDLFAQVHRRDRTLAAWWNWFRWRRFETAAVRRFRRVVVMSKKDAQMLGPGVASVVVENGVDLARFQPEPERDGERLLFIGSFRHFPEHRGIPVFHRARLAGVAAEVSANGGDGGLRARSPRRTGARSPTRPSRSHTSACACWDSWPMCGRCTWTRTSLLCPRRCRPART